MQCDSFECVHQDSTRVGLSSDKVVHWTSVSRLRIWRFKSNLLKLFSWWFTRGRLCLVHIDREDRWSLFKTFYASCPSNKKTINNNSKQKKGLTSFMIICYLETHSSSTYKTKTNSKKTILLNSTISSPIATGSLLRQSAKRTYLQGRRLLEIAAAPEQRRCFALTPLASS